MELPVQLAAIVSVLIVCNELNWPNVESSSVAVLLFILFVQHKQNLHVNMCAVATVCYLAVRGEGWVGAVYWAQQD